MKDEFFQGGFEEYVSIKFHLKNPSNGAEVFHADRQTWRR